MATRTEALEQLERANAIRFARARVKRQLFARETTVRDVLKVSDVPGVRTLEDVDAAMATMTALDLLRAQHRWGPTRAEHLLAEVRVNGALTLAALTDRQRRLIVAAVESRLTDTEREATRIAKRRARSALGPLGVECPSCRSEVGKPCSTYDPVQDRWHEPPTHPRRYIAAGLPRP
jgi:hypothetical protein